MKNQKKKKIFFLDFVGIACKVIVLQGLKRLNGFYLFLILFNLFSAGENHEKLDS